MRRNVGTLFLIILVAAVGGLYGQFLWNPIMFDDLPFFMVDHDGNQPVSNYQFGLLELRSLPYATLAWGKAWFGLDLWHFRVENMVLHLAVVVALYFFLRALSQWLLKSLDQAHLSSDVPAFWGALIFAVHPVATYATGYLVQRSILMATLFGLMAMLAYVHGSLSGRKRWLWVSVACYYFSVFSKEHAIMLPAVIFALGILVNTDWREQLRKQWDVFAAFALIALIVVLAKKGMLGSVYEIYGASLLQESSRDLAYPLSVLTQAWLFFKYAGLWLAPNPDWMSIDMREPFAQDVLSLYLVAMLAFLAWGWLAVWLLFKRGRLGLLGFAMLFPWLMFMTEFSTVRIQEQFVLYRSYIWAVGGFVLIPVVFTLFDRKVVAFVLGIFAFAFFPIAMERLSTMSHPILLWDDAEKLVRGRSDLPGEFRIYYNRGTELIKVDRYDEAVNDLKRAIELQPDLTPAYGNMGAAYLKKHAWKEAADAFSKVISIATRTGERLDMRPYLGRAMAYEEMGEMDKALLDYAVSCELAKRGCEKLGGGFKPSGSMTSSHLP